MFLTQVGVFKMNTIYLFSEKIKMVLLKAPKDY